MTAPTDDEIKAKLRELNADDPEHQPFELDMPCLRQFGEWFASRQPDPCRAILAELVRLENMTDQLGKVAMTTEFHSTKKKEAWAAARAALRQRESLLRPATTAPVGTRPAGRGMPPADDPRK